MIRIYFPYSSLTLMTDKSDVVFPILFIIFLVFFVVISNFCDYLLIFSFGNRILYFFHFVAKKKFKTSIYSLIFYVQCSYIIDDKVFCHLGICSIMLSIFGIHFTKRFFYVLLMLNLDCFPLDIL